MSSESNRPAPSSRPFFGLLMTMCLVTGCATQESPQPQTQSDRVSTQESGDSPGTGTDDASCHAYIDNLDELCNPSEKHYTLAEIAACKASQQRQYARCVRDVVVCGPQRDARELACGNKPPEGSPARAVFDACLNAAAAAWVTCMGNLLDDQP